MRRLDRERRRLLAALAGASARSRSARIRFRNAGGRAEDGTVDVLAVAFDPPRWLVAAQARGSGVLRLLDLSRFTRVRPTRLRARPAPETFDPLDFAVHRYLDPDAGPPRLVELRLPPGLAAAVPALVPTARARAGPDGRRRWHVRASRLDVLAALTGSLGGEAGLDSPPRMRSLRKRPVSATKTKRKKGSTAEARLLRLATFMLEQSEPVTRERVVEQFPDDYAGKADASERKFTRDKDALRRLGFAIEKIALGGRDEQVGYVLDARSSTLPALDLDADEAALVWTAGVTALRFSGHPLREELESALRKLVVGARGLPPRASATEDLVAGDSGAPPGALEELIDAWERRKRVTLRYWRVATDEVVERAVDVYGFASRRGEWLFVGHDHLRGGVRVFYLSRVRALSASTRRPQDPDYDVPADFDVRRWSRQQIWDYDVHPPRVAVVRFRGSLARLVKQLLPAADVRTDDEGRRVARLEVRNLRGLVRQALAWGPEAEVVEPEDGRATAREILASLSGGAA